MTRIVTNKYLRFIPAIYFMCLGAFSIVMELTHDGLSFYEGCIHTLLFLPILIPVKVVWTTFGFILSFVFGLFLLNGFVWLSQYLNGAYFKFPFETFLIGFPFIICTLLCAVLIAYMGLTSPNSVLVRIRRH